MSLSRLVDDEKLALTVSDDDVLRELRSFAEECAGSAGKFIHSTRKHVRALRVHCPDIPESVPDLPPFAFDSIDEAERTYVLQKEFREKIEELRDHLARLRSDLEEEVRRLERGENDKKSASVSGNNGSMRKSNGRREEELLKRKFLTYAYEDLHRVQAAIHSLVQRLQRIPPEAALDDDTGLEILEAAGAQRRALDSLRAFSMDASIENRKHDGLTQQITTLQATIDVLNRLANSGASFGYVRKETVFPRSWDAPITAIQADKIRRESQRNGQFDESMYTNLLSDLARVRSSAPPRMPLNSPLSRTPASPRLPSERVASVTQNVHDARERYSLDASSDPGDVRERVRSELQERLLESAREAEIRRILVEAVDRDAEKVVLFFDKISRLKGKVAGVAVSGMSTAEKKQACEFMRVCSGRMMHAELEFPESPIANDLKLTSGALFEELIEAMKNPDASKEKLLRMYKRLIERVLREPELKSSVDEAMVIGLRRMTFAGYLPHVASALERIARGDQAAPVKRVSAKGLMADRQRKYAVSEFMQEQREYMSRVHVPKSARKGRIIHME